MIDYVVGKQNQGVYHESAGVHLPDTLDLVDKKSSPVSSTGSSDLNDFLIKGYAQQIKERNSSTANVHYHRLHGSKAPVELFLSLICWAYPLIRKSLRSDEPVDDTGLDF